MPPTHHDGPGRETDVPRTTTLQVDDGLARTRQLTVAVTGVTGYVGGRLVPELLAAGHRVRALARNPCRLRGRPWYDDVEPVAADAADLEQIRSALRGVDVAYYLIHSLGTGQRSEATDRATALTFARAAREAGVKRIVHLGGLHPDVEDRSSHMAARLAGARPHRPAHRRARAAARPSRPTTAVGGRRRGLLAGRGRRAGAAPAAAGRGRAHRRGRRLSA